jgi:lantibiotic modifying enzyme
MCEASPHVTRRHAIKSGIGTLAALLATPELLRALPNDARYADAAEKVRTWLMAMARRGAHGLTWAADPTDPRSESYDLYNGMPGVVLFLLEYAHASGDQQALRDAAAAADTIVGVVNGPNDSLDRLGTGLYVGTAGLAWVLYENHRATGERRYLDAARRAIEHVKSSARTTATGVEWSPTVDIVSGAAGTGLALLALQEPLGDAGLTELAHRAARHLATLGIPEHGGRKWAMNPTFARRMPNFSHGTAGVAYFLATVAERTGDSALRETAVTGAAYLRNVATRTANGWKVFHSEPGNETLFYLSWCHGPVGTARLYERLGRHAAHRAMGEEVARLAQGIVDSGVPQQSPGYWNNISQCCGNCGIVEFFTTLYRSTRDAQQLAFAQRVMDNASGRATAEAGGLKWIQAEHRVRPELLVAQTGLMQGAAGVGLALLHLDGAMNGRADRIVLPDNPWRA